MRQLLASEAGQSPAGMTDAATNVVTNPCEPVDRLIQTAEIHLLPNLQMAGTLQAALVADAAQAGSAVR